MDGWMDGRTDGWMPSWMDMAGRRDGWVDGKQIVLQSVPMPEHAATHVQFTLWANEARDGV